MGTTPAPRSPGGAITCTPPAPRSPSDAITCLPPASRSPSDAITGASTRSPGSGVSAHAFHAPAAPDRPRLSLGGRYAPSLSDPSVARARRRRHHLAGLRRQDASARRAHAEEASGADGG